MLALKRSCCLIISFTFLFHCVKPENDANQAFSVNTNHPGILSCFVDINCDKHTDIIFISSDRKSLEVYMAPAEYGKTDLVWNQSLHVVQERQNDETISSVVPGDFNGDQYIDLLVVLNPNSASYELRLFWGREPSESGYFYDESNATIIEQKLRDQPLVLDANADMISDIFAVTSDNERIFWLGNRNVRDTTWKPTNFTTLPTKHNELHVPNSNAFVSLDGKGPASLFITSKNDSHKIIFETWKGSSEGLVPDEEYSLPDSLPNSTFNRDDWRVGQSVFADVDGDTVIDHIVPVCKVPKKGVWPFLSDGDRCVESALLLRKSGRWINLFQGVSKNFLPPRSDLHQPITVLIGEYNQDGLVDLLCIIDDNKSEKKVKSYAAVFLGKQCSGCNEAGFVFSNDSILIDNSEGAVLSGLYDFKSDGIMDVIFTTVDEKGNFITKGNERTTPWDGSFLTVKVAPGDYKEQGAAIVHGATISYTTTNAMGERQQASAVQSPQTAYNTLQLPYITFGLGRLPNFVEELEVNQPVDLFTGEPGKYPAKAGVWTMLIPNSQMYIYIDDSYWVNRVWLTPSKNILNTFIVFVATCAVIGGAIIFLHCKEKRADRMEKIQNAHRFHFDAM